MFPRRSRSLDPFLLFLPSIMITSLPRLAPRTYRYTLDLHGQLFLSSTPHKTFTSAHRDPRFLATFFRRLRPLDPLEVDPADGFVYRWVSECLGERNLLYSVCGKTPIVFTRLEEEKEQSTPSPSRSNYHNDVTRGTSYRLTVCGGRETIRLDPAQLACEEETGQLFHMLPSAGGFRKRAGCHWGLIGGRVVTEGLGGRLREALEKEEGKIWWEGVRHDLGVL